MTISVSTDNEIWEPVLKIGRAEGEEDTITASLPVHDVSWNTKTAEEIGKQARYIKLEVTKNDSHWLKINELEINDGEYIPTVNDPTYESAVSDTPDGKYGYMSDSDLSTMFIPAEDTGSLIYHLSDDTTQANSVKIIQNSSVLSDAKVSVRTLAEPEEWTEAGTLSQTINEYIMPEETCILDVKIEWEGVTPNIVELTAGAKAYVQVNKVELNRLLEKKEDTAQWTKDTAAAYEQAYRTAESLRDNDAVAQETVDSAVQALQNAAADKALRGDVSKVQSAVDGALTQSADYTASTWRAYQKAVSAAENALADPENISEAMVTELVDAINAAADALVYNPTAREEAGLLAEDAKAFMDSVTEPEKLYTEASYQALKDAYEALEAVFAANENEPQAPDVFRAAAADLETALAGLVSVEELPALIAEYDSKDPSLYTEASWKNYTEAYEAGKAAMENGTSETVSKAVEALINARDALEMEGDVDTAALRALIKEIRELAADDYTETSYSAAKALADSLESRLDEMSSTEAEQALADLTDAKNGLVWIGGLRSRVEGVKAEFSDKDAYLEDGYNALMNEIAKAEALYADATSEQVQNAVDAIDRAVKALEKKVDKDYALETVNGIVLEDTAKYTEETAKAYLDAYQALKDMLADLDHVSEAEFRAALDAFDQAEKALVLKEDGQKDEPDKGAQKDDGKAVATGDDFSAVPAAVMMFLSVAAAGVLTIKKKRQ